MASLKSVYIFFGLILLAIICSCDSETESKSDFEKMEGYWQYQWPTNEGLKPMCCARYRSDSTWTDYQGDYETTGRFWIEDGLLFKTYEAFRESDTLQSEILKLDSIDLILYRPVSNDTLSYKRKYAKNLNDCVCWPTL